MWLVSCLEKPNVDVLLSLPFIFSSRETAQTNVIPDDIRRQTDTAYTCGASGADLPHLRNTFLAAASPGSRGVPACEPSNLFSPWPGNGREQGGSS